MAISDPEIQTLLASGKAAAALSKLPRNPAPTGVDYYNLGTLALQAEQPGAAVALLTKAQRLDPSSPSTTANLEAARNSLSRTVGADHLDPASTLVERAQSYLPLSALLTLFGVLSFAGICRLLVCGGDPIQDRFFKPTISAIIGFLLTFLLTQSWVVAPPVYLLDPLTVRSGPGESYLELQRIPAGVALRELGHRDGWTQVRIDSSGDVGWLPSDALLE